MNSSNFITNEENADDNEQNTQALLFSLKTYDLGASGTNILLSYVFVNLGGTLKGTFYYASRNL